MRMTYYVYVLLCEDGSYYTGYAKDVKKRVKQHKKGRGARYTRMQPPHKLVYVEPCNSHREAIQREEAIKSLSHSQKQQLATSQQKKRTS